ncbi:MAG TPA: hypothetical protein VIL28_05145 [Steroidobacteraceae bacterium]|mgnify:FL=1
MFWLALGYPLLAHLAVVFQEPRLQWAALVWLSAISLWGALASRRIWAWSALAVSAFVLYVLVLAGGGLYALYVPPAAIPAAFLIVFARSLRPGETPMINRIAETLRGEPLPPALQIYARQVTQVWCVVFVAMFVSAIACAAWATPELWSIMTNFVHYIVLAAVFVLEFAYRRHRFRDLENWGLLEYLRRLVGTRVRY